MKVCITTVDGKQYTIKREFESLDAAGTFLRTIDVSMFKTLILCEDDVLVYTDKIVAIFKKKQ